MIKNIIKIFMVLYINLFFLTGCGSSTSTVVSPPPVSGINFNGNIISSDQSRLSNIEFSFSDNSQYSFLTDIAGDFYFKIPEESKKYINFSNIEGKSFNIYYDSLGNNLNNYMDIIFYGDLPFLLKNGLTEDQKSKIWQILNLFVNEEYNQAILDIDLFLNTANDDYKDYLLFLREISSIRLDFNNIKDGNIVNPGLYTTPYLNIDLNFVDTLDYYGSMIFILKTFFMENSSSSDINVAVSLLEKFRADETTFKDNNMALFGLTSDDIKALLILGYIYQNDTYSLDTMSGFSPSGTSIFSVHIKNMLENYK